MSSSSSYRGSSSGGSSSSSQAQEAVDHLLLKSCSGDKWAALIDVISTGARERLSHMTGQDYVLGHKRFSTLSQEEQFAVIESQYQDLQEKNEGVLSAFCHQLNSTVDGELAKMMVSARRADESKAPKDASAAAGSSSSSNNANLQSVTKICTSIISTLLLDSQRLDGPARSVSYTNTLRLFVNKPLPVTARIHVWNYMINGTAGKGGAGDLSAYSKMSPNVEVVLSKLCLALFDKHFPSVCTRARAAMVKDIIAIFMKLNNISMPSKDEDTSAAEQLFFLSAPLLIVFTGCQQLEEGFDFDGIPDLVDSDATATAASVSSSAAAASSAARDATFYVTRKLVLVTAPAITGLLESRSLLRTAPELARTLQCLSKANALLAGKLKQIKRDSVLYRHASFDDYVNFQLLRLLGACFNLETLLFVWDQGVITSFGAVVPLVFCSCLLALEAQLMELTTLEGVVDLLEASTMNLQPVHVQRLLSQYFKEELAAEVGLEGGFAVTTDDDGILQAVYDKIF